MIKLSSCFPTKTTGAVVVLAALLVSGCVAQNSAPQQVKASNPSVTYKYRGDQELLQANQNAMTFCSQYHSAARTSNITDSPEGGKTVVFECDAMPPTVVVAAAQPYNPNLAYAYRSDQDLFDASRNADIYCMNNGSQRAMSTVVTNPNGTKSVSFQCVPR
jgi:hypothetical protein